MTYLLAFLLTFSTIGLKASQQQHVTAGRKLWIPPTSVAMQFLECLTWGWGVQAYLQADYWQMFVMGLGAGTGTLVAMWADERWLKRPV